MVDTDESSTTKILWTKMDAQATPDRVVASPFPMQWDVLSFLQHFNTSFTLDFPSFYSSRECQMRPWYSDTKLAATKQRKKTTAKMNSDRFEKYYRAGKPLFTRAALLDIATQISSGQPVIHLDDFHGLSKPQRRSRVPDWLSSG